MSDERIEQIERELRAPGSRETAGRGRPLPSDVSEARRLLSQIDGRRNAGRVVMRAGAIGLAAAAAVAVAIAIGATRPGILPVGESVGPSATSQPNPTPVATPTPAASQGSAACEASNLRATSERWGAAAGSRGTTIHVTLASGPDCVLQGHPGARIVDSTGSEAIASLDPANRPDHPWMNPGDQPITMSVGGLETTVVVTWSNWCSPVPAEPRLELRVATDGPHLPVSAAAGDSVGVPPCMGASQTSVLGTYPFGG